MLYIVIKEHNVEVELSLINILDCFIPTLPTIIYSTKDLLEYNPDKHDLIVGLGLEEDELDDILGLRSQIILFSKVWYNVENKDIGKNIYAVCGNYSYCLTTTLMKKITQNRLHGFIYIDEQVGVQTESLLLRNVNDHIMGHNKYRNSEVIYLGLEDIFYRTGSLRGIGLKDVKGLINPLFR